MGKRALSCTHESLAFAIGYYGCDLLPIKTSSCNLHVNTASFRLRRHPFVACSAAVFLDACAALRLYPASLPAASWQGERAGLLLLRPAAADTAAAAASTPACRRQPLRNRPRPPAAAHAAVPQPLEAHSTSMSHQFPTTDSGGRMSTVDTAQAQLCRPSKPAVHCDKPS